MNINKNTPNDELIAMAYDAFNHCYSTTLFKTNYNKLYNQLMYRKIDGVSLWNKLNKPWIDERYNHQNPIWYSYVIISNTHKLCYVGITKNLNQRKHQHMNMHSKYCRSTQVCKLDDALFIECGVNVNPETEEAILAKTYKTKGYKILNDVGNFGLTGGGRLNKNTSDLIEYVLSKFNKTSDIMLTIPKLLKSIKTRGIQLDKGHTLKGVVFGSLLMTNKHISNKSIKFFMENIKPIDCTDYDVVVSTYGELLHDYVDFERVVYGKLSKFSMWYISKDKTDLAYTLNRLLGEMKGGAKYLYALAFLSHKYNMVWLYDMVVKSLSKSKQSRFKPDVDAINLLLSGDTTAYTKKRGESTKGKITQSILNKIDTVLNEVNNYE